VAFTNRGIRGATQHTMVWVSIGVSMAFYFQLGNPRTNFISIEEEESLRDILENLFVLETEDLILSWNGTRVPISYKYDLPILIDDALELIDVININKSGKREVFWASDTFRSLWNISWDDRLVKCHSAWESTLGGIEQILNSRPDVECEKDAFLAEWGCLFYRIKNIIIKNDLNIALIANYATLDRVTNEIPTTGYLYPTEGRNPESFRKAHIF
jgi:hypothetical protein